jgi:hypothetical protein
MDTRGSRHRSDAVDALCRTTRESRTMLGDLLRLRHGDSWELNVADGRLAVRLHG